MTTIDTILDEIIRREGGYVNHPADRGGPTKFGITAQTLGAWRKLGRAATAAEVQALTENEARAIYRQQYITGPGLDVITHPGLLHLLVDSGVHSGPKRAVQWLQSALGDGRRRHRPQDPRGTGCRRPRCALQQGAGAALAPSRAADHKRSEAVGLRCWLDEPDG